MTERDELFEALMPVYRAKWAPGEEESTNALLDAYEAAVERRLIRELVTDIRNFLSTPEGYGAWWDADEIPGAIADRIEKRLNV